MNAEEAWLTQHATLMTTEAIPAYGGFSADRSVLEQAAARINDGTVPMHVGHDLTQPLRVRNQVAAVIDRDDGLTALRMSYEVHPDDAAKASMYTGMSVTLTDPLRSWSASANGPLQASILLNADAGWFGDEAIVEAGEILSTIGGVRAGRAFQFEMIPDPQIFLDLTFATAQAAWYSGVVGNAVWDSVKLLFSRRQAPGGGSDDTPTRINFRIDDGTRQLTALVETRDVDVAEKAIDALGSAIDKFFDQPAPGVAPTRGISIWNEEAGAWTNSDQVG